MQIHSMEVGPIGTNCYIVVNEANKEGVMVDPGGSAADLRQFIEGLAVEIKAIFLTHGHMDHIGALEAMKNWTGAPIYISRADEPMLNNPTSNLAAFMGTELHCPPADKLYGQGDVVEAAGLRFEVLSTPGHTPGGVCLHCADAVFCGDTIFCESIGRTDFPGGSYGQIIDSIKTKILTLPKQTKLYPGHGPSTTVDWEKRRNPFLQ